MHTDDILPPITSDKLIDALNNPELERKVIAEGFIYEKTCLLINSDPGTGKSTVSTQVAVELACGLPVFGFFHVPKPIKVLYIQCERSILETIERLKVINQTYPINKDNLAITDEFQRLDFLNANHANLFIDCIKRDFPDVEMIILDPIYAMVSGGLKDDRPATFFTRLIRHIQKEFGCAFWLCHHTTKTQYTSDGSEVKKKHRFYGAQWIMASATGSYDMLEKEKKEEGVKLVCDKDNYSILTKEIDLLYNPETELCMVDSEKLTALDKVKNFILAQKLANRRFTFNDITAKTLVCTRKVREILAHHEIRALLLTEVGEKNKLIYIAK